MSLKAKKKKKCWKLIFSNESALFEVSLRLLNTYAGSNIEKGKKKKKITWTSVLIAN